MSPSAKPVFSTLLLVSASVLLAACGGGGGGGTTTTTIKTIPTPTPNNPSDITSDNSPKFAAHALDAGQSVGDTGDDSSSLVTGIELDVQKTSLLAQTLTELYAAMSVNHHQIAVGATETKTIQCSGGGTSTLTVNYIDAAKISAGDTLSVANNNCVGSAGNKTQGTITFVFNSDINSSTSLNSFSAWKADMTIAFINASTTNTAGVTETNNGDLRINIDHVNATTGSVQLTNTALTNSVAKNGASATETLANVNIRSQRNGSNFSHLYNFRAYGQNSKLGTFDYTVSTQADLVGTGQHPSAGKLTVVGASKGRVVATVLNSTQVQLETDTNNDGNTDDTKILTWSELDALVN